MATRKGESGWPKEIVAAAAQFKSKKDLLMTIWDPKDQIKLIETVANPERKLNDETLTPALSAELTEIPIMKALAGKKIP